MELQEIIADLDMFLNENTKTPEPKPEPIRDPVDYSEAKALEVVKSVLSGINQDDVSENVNPDALASSLFEGSIEIMESLLEGPDHADHTFEETIKFFEQVAQKGREILKSVTEKEEDEEEEDEPEEKDDDKDDDAEEGS
jgi:hypothetical protein